MNDENHTRILIRWDRLYQTYIENERKLSGYWHINAHRPEVTFLPHQEDEKPESWHLEVNKNELRLTGISDTNKNQQRHYIRLHKF